MKTRIVIELPDHAAEAVVELSKKIDLGTLLRDALGEFASKRTSSVQKSGVKALRAAWREYQWLLKHARAR